MDVLIVLSTSTAYIYSVAAYAFLVCGKPLSTGEFFETSTLLVTLIMIGQSAAKCGSQTALESVSMEPMLQTQMVTIVAETGVEEKIDSRLLQESDVFRVYPDEKVVTDGVIIEGETEVDEVCLELVHRSSSALQLLLQLLFQY
jgi:cation transport ATPase